MRFYALVAAGHRLSKFRKRAHLQGCGGHHLGRVPSTRCSEELPDRRRPVEQSGMQDQHRRENPRAVLQLTTPEPQGCGIKAGVHRTILPLKFVGVWTA
jgi:hypothetical protein